MQPSLEHHTLTFTGPHDAVRIVGDEVRLRQVILNLLQNAIKYSPKGGPVEIVVEQFNATACVRVSDQGIGIPAEALPQIFQSFYRAPNAEAYQIRGMGVGLYVVKEIITLHGGTIDVVSREGEGSTFTIKLPLA